MNTKKGFTIIELIVVIAIIAVLAAIVLVNVTSYINKGKDASAKGNLTTLLTNSAVYFDTNSNYTGFNTSAGWNTVSSALTAAGYTITQQTNSTAFCAYVNLKNTNNFCVDSSGNKVEKASGSCTAQACN